MRNKLFDEHVKKQFDGYRPEVAPHIWEKITAEQSRRKPAPFWLSLFANKWMVAALLLVTATGTGIYITHRHAAKVSSGSDVVSAQELTHASQKNQSPSTTNTKSDNIITVLPSANNKQNANNNSSVMNGAPVKSNTGNTFNNNYDQSNPESADIKLNAQTDRNKNKYVTGVSKININNTEGITDNASLPNTNRNTETVSNSFENKLSRTAHPFDLLPAIRTNNNLAALKIKKLPVSGTIPCPPAERDAAGDKSYFEVYAGPDYVFRSFADTANSAYLKERKATVRAAFSYSAGVRYTKVFRNGLSIRTGLNYSRINERFKYVKGNVTHNIYITNAAGDTTGTFVERGTQYQQSTNVYHSFDIPVVAGYELGNDRIHANLSAGVMINILSRQKGYVLDPSGSPIDISSGKSNSLYSYKTNTGVSFLGSFSVYYKLNDKFHLLAEPYLRYGLSTVTKTDISLKQKNHTAGLRIGLRMDL